MLHIGQADLRACLDAVHAIGAASTSSERFARAGVANLKRLVSSELATLSVCDRDSGHRSVVSDLPGAIASRAIAIAHAMAVPIHVDRTLLVSFVFNRRGRDFDDRERERLEVIRPHLGDLYRMARALDDARAAWGVSSAARRPLAEIPLTAREREVLHWLTGGKTDKDIGGILGISPRTVHKHLQRIYEKLGVETRTAAVVRAMTPA